MALPLSSMVSIAMHRTDGCGLRSIRFPDQLIRFKSQRIDKNASPVMTLALLIYINLLIYGQH
jgi:hypothetical protein